MTVLDEPGRSRHASLTACRKDGGALATPVRHAVDGGGPYL